MMASFRASKGASRCARDRRLRTPLPLLALAALAMGALAHPIFAQSEEPPRAGFPAWSAGQALGPPDSAPLGFQETAWAPLGVNTGLEWLELQFVPVEHPSAVILHAPEEPAALVGLLLGDAQGVTLRVEPVERGELVTPGIVRFPLEPLRRPLGQVTLLFDTRRSATMAHVDAVGVEEAAADDGGSADGGGGADAVVRWAESVRASSSWAHAPARLVTSHPPADQSEVDPALGEVVFVFDRDMDTSRDGGAPVAEGPFASFVPGGAADALPFWRGARQYVVPVSLEPAHFYRLALNVDRPGEFVSALGAPLLPTVLTFATEGADGATRARLEPPRVVRAEPPPGTTGVDPGLAELRFTFSAPMSDGVVWRVLGTPSPLAPGGAPAWNDERTAWTMPVALAPRTEYRVALNMPDDLGFQSASGVPLEPIIYRFVTGGGEAAE